MSELGSLLKERREKEKKTLKEISEETRIRESFLVFIEKGEYDKLPSYLHSYGFVKKYAELLGFDYDTEIMELFQKECPKSPSLKTDSDSIVIVNEDNQEETFTDINKSENKGSFKGLIIFFVLLGIAYGAYILYTNDIFHSDKPEAKIVQSDNQESTITINQTDNGIKITENQTDRNKDEVVDNTIVFTTDNASSEDVVILDTTNIDTPETVTQELVIPEKHKVTVSFSDECWFQYSLDDGPKKEFTSYKGMVFILEFEKSFHMSLGNAAAVSLRYKDQVIADFGRAGRPRNNLRYEIIDDKLQLVR